MRAPAAQDYLADELARRGADAASAVARALLSAPLCGAASIFGESLVRLLQREEAVRDLVVTTLIEAAGAALDAGSGSAGAASSIQQLRDCASLSGSVPEAAPVARRLLAAAAAEAEPYLPAVDAAEQLVRGAPSGA